eukprot:365274-Chlamydomonas_euryale.AAC.13
MAKSYLAAVNAKQACRCVAAQYARAHHGRARSVRVTSQQVTILASFIDGKQGQRGRDERRVLLARRSPSMKIAAHLDTQPCAYDGLWGLDYSLQHVIMAIRCGHAAANSATSTWTTPTCGS